MKSSIARSQFVSLLLNQIPVEFIGLKDFLIPIVNAFNVSIKSIISLAENNEAFLRKQITNELQRCFPIDAINPYYNEIDIFDLMNDNSSEETQKSEMIEIKDQNDQQMEEIEFKPCKQSSKLTNVIQYNG